MFGPLIKSSPSSAILTSTPGNGLPTLPNRCASGLQAVDRPPAGDGEHPGLQAPRGIEAAADPPHLHEHDLDDVVDIRVRDPAAQVAPQDRPEFGVATIERVLTGPGQPKADLSHPV